MKHIALAVLTLLSATPFAPSSAAQMTTWDGRHQTSQIRVHVVYYVPADRRPLPDWRDRVSYFCKRIERFHQREFGGQSKMSTVVHEQPLVSELTTAELQNGDANTIWRKTVFDAGRRIGFPAPVAERDAFPILLVLSDINWKPLDDFYRVRPAGDDLAFEGVERDGHHFPGAASGGSRAAYFSEEGCGRGLVSADGWRVPYRGTDCVVYHEGCGHTVGLPHPEPPNGSVMSLAQYRGWISESWLDREQKIRLGWQPQPVATDLQTRLFSEFRALPEPVRPKPDERVRLRLDWPKGAEVQQVRVRYQTSLFGPWVESPVSAAQAQQGLVELATFDRETPVSYRVDVRLKTGETEELWGYFQVRSDSTKFLRPWTLCPDLVCTQGRTPADSSDDQTTKNAQWPSAEHELDLLKITDPAQAFTVGRWQGDGEGRLVSPAQYGARIELPCIPPDEYRLLAIVEPLDEPNGLILGHRSGASRFVTLFSFRTNRVQSAIENVDGKNVGNSTTWTGSVFQKNVPAEVVVIVRRTGVTMMVDGRVISQWKGTPDQLSLSDYWKTPHPQALFLGTYNCRYRFSRVSLLPLSGKPRLLVDLDSTDGTDSKSDGDQ